MTVLFQFFGESTQTESISLQPGVYKFECWGAQGRDDFGSGGKGGYVSGFIKFRAAQKLFVYVGGIGSSNSSAFNGGGNSQNGGGGASDIRLIGGEWSNFSSLKSRIMVAGAGAGADGYQTGTSSSGDSGGSAGGLNGFDSQHEKGKGGTQTAGGSGPYPGKFGKGGGNIVGADEDGHGAGGGGYFGGSGSSDCCFYGGGGGSSYISGYDGCKSINESSPNENKIEMTDESIHYAKLSFYKMTMIDGNSDMLSPYGEPEKGHRGYGAVRISIIIHCTCQSGMRLRNYLILFITFNFS